MPNKLILSRVNYYAVFFVVCLFNFLVLCSVYLQCESTERIMQINSWKKAQLAEENNRWVDVEYAEELIGSKQTIRYLYVERKAIGTTFKVYRLANGKYLLYSRVASIVLPSKERVLAHFNSVRASQSIQQEWQESRVYDSISVEDDFLERVESYSKSLFPKLGVSSQELDVSFGTLFLVDSLLATRDVSYEFLRGLFPYIVAYSGCLLIKLTNGHWEWCLQSSGKTVASFSQSESIIGRSEPVVITSNGFKLRPVSRTFRALFEIDEDSGDLVAHFQSEYERYMRSRD